MDKSTLYNAAIIPLQHYMVYCHFNFLIITLVTYHLIILQT